MKDIARLYFVWSGKKKFQCKSILNIIVGCWSLNATDGNSYWNSYRIAALFREDSTITYLIGQTPLPPPALPPVKNPGIRRLTSNLPFVLKIKSFANTKLWKILIPSVVPLSSWRLKVIFRHFICVEFPTNRRRPSGRAMSLQPYINSVYLYPPPCTKNRGHYFSWFLESVLVLTADGRSLVGTLISCDQLANIVLGQTVERIIRPHDDPEPSAEVTHGLYIIRGENVAVCGLMDEELDSSIDWVQVRGNVVGGVKHVWFGQTWSSYQGSIQDSRDGYLENWK